MNSQRSADEELLRELACNGDLSGIRALFGEKPQLNINSQNAMNGWTALHWAAKRNHQQVVEYLLENGADRSIQAHSTSTPAHVCGNDTLRAVLEGRSTSGTESLRSESLSSLPIIPNYLRNPVFPYVSSTPTPLPPVSDDQTVTLLCRIADDPSESDFVEFDFCKTPTHGSYQRLLHILGEEFNLDHIDKIRRLPHVRIRNDRDVARLKENHMLEIVQMKSEVTLSSPSSTDTLPHV